MSDPVRVPAAVFGGDEFWARLNRLADERGHAGHIRWLVGEAERTDRYRLECQPCRTVVTELTVHREGDGHAVATN